METSSEQTLPPAQSYACMTWLQLFLYLTFCTIAYYIPGEVPFGQSLVFAYIFCMMQMTTMYLFNGNKQNLALAVVSAIALPSWQILGAITMNYTLDIMASCSVIYMGRELFLYITIRGNSIFYRPMVVKSAHDKGAIFMLVVWAASGIALYFIVIDPYREQTVTDKVLYIIHFTPLFWLCNINVKNRVYEDIVYKTGCVGFM